MKQILWFTLAFVAPIAMSQAASFDCAKASTKVERMICDNAELSKLDEDMSAKYRMVLKDPIKLKALDITQKQWLDYRDRCESDLCIWDYYKTRLFELGFIIDGLKKHKVASRYIIEEEMNGGEPIPEEEKDSDTIEDEPFCKAVLDTLNNTNPNNYKRPCLADEVLKLPGVTNPVWSQLDLAAHEDLAKKIIALGIAGVHDYFFAKDKLPPPANLQATLNYEKQHDAELFILQLPPQFFGDRKLVTLTYRGERCGTPMSKIGEGYHAAWVTPDLKEIATGPGLFDSWAGRPFMYRGKLHLMRTYGAGDTLELYVPAKEFLSKTCSIRIVGENVNQ